MRSRSREAPLGMLDRRRDQRAALGLPEDRNTMWEALIELHNGRPCHICCTPGLYLGFAGPAPDPAYTWR